MRPWTRRWQAFGGALTLALARAYAQGAAELPEYRPGPRLSECESIRSWGSGAMGGLMKSWEKGFRSYQPGVRFSDTLKGTETAQAALYTDVADLALMDREILMLERHVLLRRRHRLPLEITVATGSHDVPAKTFALAVFVHRDNPISRLTLRQLDGIFGDQRAGAWDDKFRWHPERGRSASENIRTWGQLGLTGAWVDEPIRVYGYPITIYSPFPGPMLFFRVKAFGGGDTWNPGLLEFDRGEQITEGLGKDRFGIGYTCLSYRTPLVKPIALAAADGGGDIDLTRENVARRRYPLTRSVYIYIDRAPEKAVDPKVKEFLRYILSRQGQQDVAREGDYLPLTADVVVEQLEKLK
jgi:phosphate transport system substrate-binding protein